MSVKHSVRQNRPCKYQQFLVCLILFLSNLCSSNVFIVREWVKNKRIQRISLILNLFSKLFLAANHSNSNMVREKGSDNIEDGADESMLNNDEKDKLALKDEVQFISGDQQNGNAKINIGTIDKVSKCTL